MYMYYKRYSEWKKNTRNKIENAIRKDKNGKATGIDGFFI